MLQALLQNKLTRNEEDMEDLLTSNIFGLLKYVPAETALIPWLQMAVNPTLPEQSCTWLNDVGSVSEWSFWPRMCETDCMPCEPDVLLKFTHLDGQQTWLLIEAKYHSGKSSTASEDGLPPYDQLAKEYDNLARAAEVAGVSRFAVIYLTTEMGFPALEIAESLNEYQRKRGFVPGIYWLSWRMLSDVIVDASNPILLDLRQFLAHLDLLMFRRVRTPIGKIDWSFSVSKQRWKWSQLPQPNWKFQELHARRVTDPKATTASSFSWRLAVDPHGLFGWSNK
jgi:hypothetical protein